MTPDRRNASFPTFFGDFPDPGAMAMALRGIDVGPERRRSAATIDKRLRSVLGRGELGPLNVAVARYGEGIPQTFIAGKAHTFTFPTEPSIVRRVSGHTLGGRQIFHFRPDDQTVASSPAGMPWAFGIITVPLGGLHIDGPNVTGLDTGVPLDDDRMFLAPEDAMARLVGLMKDFGRIVRDTPWVIDEPAPATALAGCVMDALLTCLTQGQARPDRAALRRHRQIVARFEAALRERPEEMLSLSAICAAVGVAERTLSLACQEFLGQSAMQYARGRRLDLVAGLRSRADAGHRRGHALRLLGAWPFRPSLSDALRRASVRNPPRRRGSGPSSLGFALVHAEIA
jgi:AraC-like DNA-binding protein